MWFQLFPCERAVPSPPVPPGRRSCLVDGVVALPTTSQSRHKGRLQPPTVLMEGTGNEHCHLTVSSRHASRRKIERGPFPGRAEPRLHADRACQSERFRPNRTQC